MTVLDGCVTNENYVEVETRQAEHVSVTGQTAYNEITNSRIILYARCSGGHTSFSRLSNKKTTRQRRGENKKTLDNTIALYTRTK